MLSENIRNLRKGKGLSQEDLAVRLSVVRQTISKWEKGLSVPDAELLIRLAEELDTTVATLLDKTEEPQAQNELNVIAAKLETLNRQFAAQNERRRSFWHTLCLMLGLCSLLLVGGYLTSFVHETHVIGAIGGQDGPTQIFVTSDPWAEGVLLALAALIVAVVGFYKTRKR